MCGRFGLFTDLSELVELLGFELGWGCRRVHTCRLNDAADQTILLEALKPCEWQTMQAQEANPAVGSTRNDGPYLLGRQSSFFR